jgi:hypothetical protein
VTHIPRGHQKVIFSHPSSFHDSDVEKAKAKGCFKWWSARHFIPKAPEKKERGLNYGFCVTILLINLCFINQAFLENFEAKSHAHDFTCKIS